MAERSKNFISSHMPNIKLNSLNKAIDVMFNTFLPYQNIAGRIFGRTGFYQSSGAFGYRDQLQDMAGLVYSSPQLVKAHIYRAAAHQFIEGDVQHWWHNIKTPDSSAGAAVAHRGVRTKCSDDYLWLPYITAFYINKTGDYSVLDTKVEYITDAPLGKDEKERYSEPKKSGIKESIYEHCIKSIEYGLKFGEHGLPLIGTCDWNDGMSLVGAEGKGESVWLAQFLILVLRGFINICENRGDSETAQRYKTEAEKIKEAIELYCFENDKYIRGFYDNGDRLGSQYNDECKIDILPQAFAAIIDNSERAEIAMNTAYENLFDDKYKILKLFTPAFSESVQNPGYIKSYVPGIRENGGQYTHGAVWGALGFLTLGTPEFYKKGWEIIKALNPALRCTDKRLSDIYRIEPYVLSGDIYSNESHTGRGGWSWYTGSASWYYRIILENLLGFELSGDKFSINPIAIKYIDDFDIFSLEIKLKGSVYNINISKNTKNTGLKISLDSKEVVNPITICEGIHTVDIVI
jgi:cyclic beta-1,2-glucan synthetase